MCQRRMTEATGVGPLLLLAHCAAHSLAGLADDRGDRLPADCVCVGVQRGDS